MYTMSAVDNYHWEKARASGIIIILVIAHSNAGRCHFKYRAKKVSWPSQYIGSTPVAPQCPFDPICQAWGF